jgi:hypothetical protein
MVPKSGSKLPFRKARLTDRKLAETIGSALRIELGGSRRATKTVMQWTGVSDHTARSWINGHTSPSSLHLLEIASHSRPVMATVLTLTGNDNLELGCELLVVERVLESALAQIRAMHIR